MLENFKKMVKDMEKADKEKDKKKNKVGENKFLSFKVDLSIPNLFCRKIFKFNDTSNFTFQLVLQRPPPVPSFHLDIQLLNLRMARNWEKKAEHSAIF